MGCGSWLTVTRNTVTHEIMEVALASTSGLGGPA
jgi:sarcosine oxidase subunit delta